MLEHNAEHYVDEERMDPDYRQIEDAFRAKAARLHEKERTLREMIRSDVDLSPEQRQQQYISGYRAIEEDFERLVEGFGRETGQRVLAAQKKLASGKGERFAAHLAGLANVPDGRLGELMRSAERSGQKDLAQAVAVTAYERGIRPVFERWVESDPERAEALRTLRGTPGAAQLYDRTAKAMRPPKADLRALEPTREDVRRAQEKRERASRERRAFFFDGVRRQVGSRVF